MTPIRRACNALRLPAGAYLHRGILPCTDGEIRANLRRMPAPVAGLAEAIADTIRDLDATPDDAEDAAVVVLIAEQAAARRALSPSMVGVVVALAVTARADGGEVSAEEWASLCRVTS